MYHHQTQCCSLAYFRMSMSFYCLTLKFLSQTFLMPASLLHSLGKAAFIHPIQYSALAPPLQKILTSSFVLFLPSLQRLSTAASPQDVTSLQLFRFQKLLFFAVCTPVLLQPRAMRSFLRLQLFCQEINTCIFL